MQLKFIASLCLMCISAACSNRPALAPTASAVEVRAALPAPNLVDLTPEQRAYRIGPYDTIAVQVFNAPDLNREGMVDASGNFALPLIGNVQALGLTPLELSGEIADRLRGRFIRDPQVTVGVREVRSQRVTIDGAVMQPGIYPVIGRMTLQQAIATARGTNEFARLSQVVIFRTVQDQQLAAVFSLADIRSGVSPDPEVYGNDVIVVDTNDNRRLLRDVLQALPALGVFTPIVR